MLGGDGWFFVITVGAGVAPLTRLDGVEVSLTPVVMGELTVHASLGKNLMPLLEMLATWAAAEVDFSGYYRVEPASSPRLGAGRAQPASMGAQAVSLSAPLTSATTRRQRWPWPSGLDPFVLMVHTSADGAITLVVDGEVRPATVEALGSWLRRLFGLSVARRALENPLVVVTCALNAGQVLADEVGRLVWFTDGMTTVRAQPVDPQDPAGGGRVVLEVHAAGAGRDRRSERGGRLRSVYPQGPAGDRVRQAMFQGRTASQAARWLLERPAEVGSPAPAHARAQVFGRGSMRGLSYFDQRDHASRARVLDSSVLGSTYVTWTPNPAYRPGTPPGPGPIPVAAAQPWNVRELGELPFDWDTTVPVLTHYTAGRLSVYTPLWDISYWVLPQAFGTRLRDDLTSAIASGAFGAHPPTKVVLLTDLETVPEEVRAQVDDALKGLDLELITVNTPATLFQDDTSERGTPTARIALLPTTTDPATTVSPPKWIFTSREELPTMLSGESSGQNAGLRRFAIEGVAASSFSQQVHDVRALVNGRGGALARVSGAPGLVWNAGQVAAAMQLLHENASRHWAHDRLRAPRLGTPFLGWVPTEYAERLVRLATDLGRDPLGGMWLSGSGPGNAPSASGAASGAGVSAGPVQERADRRAPSLGERAQAVLATSEASDFRVLRVRALLGVVSAPDRDWRSDDVQGLSDRGRALERAVVALEEAIARGEDLAGGGPAPAVAGRQADVGAISGGQAGRQVSSPSGAPADAPLGPLRVGAGVRAAAAARVSEEAVRLWVSTVRAPLERARPENVGGDVEVWERMLDEDARTRGPVAELVEDVEQLGGLPGPLEHDLDVAADLLVTLQLGRADHGLVEVRGEDTSLPRLPLHRWMRAMLIIRWAQDRLAAPRYIYGRDAHGRRTALRLDGLAVADGRESGVEAVDDTPLDPRVSFRDWFRNLSLADLRRALVLLDPADTHLVDWTALVTTLATPLDYETEQTELAQAGHAPAMTNLGLLHQQQGATGQAQDWYRRAAAAGDAPAMFNLGRLLEQRGATGQALLWYQRAATAGHAPAMTDLGRLLQQQGATGQAQYRYRRAAAAGDAPAMFNLGHLFQQQGDLGQAQHWYRRAATAGHAPAMFNLAVMFQQQKNLGQAQHWYERAADAEHAPAMTNLGVMFQQQKDLVQAQHWYERAADAGHVPAMFNLGLLRRQQKDLGQAEHWYERAAEAGHVPAMFNLAVLLEQRGATGQAQPWYERAATAGHAPAMTNLGLLLQQQGKTGQAQPWYERAAADGNLPAMNNLGLLLQRQGKTGQAQHWYRRAADAGHAPAMFNLGHLLQQQGATVQAQHWYQRAATAGHAPAISLLGRLRQHQGETGQPERHWST